MKLRIIITLILVLSLCTGCASASAPAASNAPNTALSDEQLAELGIPQEDSNVLSEEEIAEQQAFLDEQKAKENASMEEPTAPADNIPTEPQEIDVEADIQKYLDKLPPLPSGERTYDYEWSKKLDRISRYLVTISPASAYEVYDFLGILEMEYGYISDGKEMWDAETDTATYGYSTDTSHIYVSVTPTGDDGQEVSVTIYISYNPYF